MSDPTSTEFTGQPDSEAERIVRSVLRKHYPGVVFNEETRRHDAACAECQAPLPWGEDARARVIQFHQARVIVHALGLG